MSAQSIGDALLLLAGQFQSEGSVTAAIQCLEGVAQSPDALLPLTEARARRQLAALLLAHTHNVAEAKAHLEKSQLLLPQLHGQWDLKLGITSDLGRCHKLLGNVQLQQHMYQTGLELCKGARQSRTCAAVDSWEVHFLLRLADTLVTTGETASALAMIDAGLAQAVARHPDLRMKILCHLFMLQVHLVDWSGKEPAESALESAASLFAQLPPERHHERLTLQLKLHFHVLRVLLLMRLGKMAELAQPGGGEGKAPWMPGTLCAMEDLLTQLGGAEGALWEYEWAPPPTVAALAHLLFARILEPSSKIKHVLAHLNKCHSLVDQELAALGVSYSPAEDNGSREMELPHHAIWDSRLLLVLRFLALEMQANVFLTMVDLPSAQQTIRAAVELMNSFPMLLTPLRPSLQFMLGLYCHSTGACSQAYSCFMTSREESGSVQWANLATCNAALALLANNTPSGMRQAAEVLGDLPAQALAMDDTGDSGNQAMSLQERAASLLCQGILESSAGATTEAKFSLSKALRIAHGQLASQQMTCQILNALGPLSWQSGDVSGAEQMLASSFQIAKGIHDSPGLLGALAGMNSVLSATGQLERAAQNQEYSNRKSAEVQQIGNAARSLPDHAYLLQCAVSCLEPAP